MHYDDPVAWLLAPVELRSDGEHLRALALYELWIELNPEHHYAGLALNHALDCAIEGGDAEKAESLFIRYALDSDEDEREGMRVRIDAMAD